MLTWERDEGHTRREEETAVSFRTLFPLLCHKRCFLVFLLLHSKVWTFLWSNVRLCWTALVLRPCLHSALVKMLDLHSVTILTLQRGKLFIDPPGALYGSKWHLFEISQRIRQGQGICLLCPWLLSWYRGVGRPLQAVFVMAGSHLVKLISTSKEYLLQVMGFLARYYRMGPNITRAWL